MNRSRLSNIAWMGLALIALGSFPGAASAIGPGPGHVGPGPCKPKPTFTLTIEAAGNGSTYPAAGKHVYPAGTRVRVAAVPAFGDTFTGWSGDAEGSADPIVVVMDANKSITAAFAQGKSWISKLPNPPGVGVRRPSGKPANLAVVDWAGFAGAISYTFDDALDSQIQNYPALHAGGVPVTFYLNPFTSTAFTQAERVAAFKQWAADGNELGNHTAYHCNVDAGVLAPTCAWSPDNNPVPGTTPDSEIADTTTWLEKTLGEPGVWTMASPYGDADWDAFAEKAGMLVHRDVYQGMLAPNDLTNQYHLPVYMAGAPQWGGLDDQQASYEKVIDDARAAKSWALFLFHQIGPATDTIGCCEVPVGNITGSMSHLEALGDVWGDTVVNVAAYWVGQKLLSSATPTTRGRATVWTWALPANFPPHKYLRVKVDGGTLSQHGRPLVWDEHGYYEVALDAESLTLTP
jgi:peptidoglycan/xylan/chitin deacetylase (PgdA/CDA1 family)